ncbi:hypothetical protein bt91E135_001024 (plasmid) [Borrelia turicatae 91E135]|nr:hypothetical protein [Borrelia turicatae]UPA13902.1 hypothetical protein bt91E135_001024 [Borrelia turicatae 91E135]
MLSFREAFKLASDEIIKIIDNFILTGTVTVKKNGRNQQILLPNMYGLLNMPNQVKEEVEASNKDKMDKIFAKNKVRTCKIRARKRILNTYDGIS